MAADRHEDEHPATANWVLTPITEGVLLPRFEVSYNNHESRRVMTLSLRSTRTSSIKRAGLVAAIAAVGLTLVAGVSSASPSSSSGASAAADGREKKVELIRQATDDFHNISTAEAAGYVALKDIHGKYCIAMKGMGGMGVHYVNPGLIGDPTIDPKTPESLVYAPDRDGTLRLAAVEYIVDKATWDANHDAAPVIFAGHPFDEIGSPNRFGLDPFYAQHVWVWQFNPVGLLSMWNPAVHCSWACPSSPPRLREDRTSLAGKAQSSRNSRSRRR
jgi:hypothetical protein